MIWHIVFIKVDFGHWLLYVYWREIILIVLTDTFFLSLSSFTPIQLIALTRLLNISWYLCVSLRLTKGTLFDSVRRIIFLAYAMDTFVDMTGLVKKSIPK
jgi:hypothetical protein